jgi:hypothetical protein
MNELFDKLILRIIFTGFICLMLVVYRYLHIIFYQSTRTIMLKTIRPASNPADTLHIFGRILGIGIIFSELHFSLSEGIWVSLLDFFLQSITSFVLYLFSLFIIESIVLYSFDYEEEITRKSNMAFALIGFAHSLAMAFVVKTVIAASGESLVMIILLWLFSMVLLGLWAKAFHLTSTFSFNRMLLSKSIPLAISYLGFIFGATLIMTSAMHNPMEDVRFYAINTILKILLALIIFPFFKFGLKKIFKIEKINNEEMNYFNETGSDDQSKILGIGLYEGIIGLTTAYLTTVITENIDFGTFYPVF